ncbi:hypothetical protein IMCC21224_112417 [Puniceibacterium sp. IMCC21224]|nr:DinB family protein [Puniceibacterium sp. IMCC21224]KMK67546.1 hypothetical protein IMCC21224_112417 [Puniceibacterium sp. IMCC21224]
MIGPEYCDAMARYNAWQNWQMADAFAGLDVAEFEADRQGFFGSIQATANHLLWADLMWMSRFEDGDAPTDGIGGSVRMTQNLAEWRSERLRLDARILGWSGRVGTGELAGPLTWVSGLVGREVTRDFAPCVVHMFNHQTHHRGQIHAMLTQAGAVAPVTDFAFMPDTGAWL